MKWGVEHFWGGFWGLDAGDANEAACVQAQDGILSQFDQDGQFYELICALSEAHGDYWDVAEDLIKAFDLDYAIGAQLDVIGRILKQPRNAFGDDVYRKLLKIKGKLVLRSTGTGENIIAIVREYLTDAVLDPIIVNNSPPYTFKLSVPTLSEADLDVLIPFIREALIAAVSGVVIVILDGGAVWGSDAVAVADSGIWGSANVVVPNATVWSRVIII